VHAVEELLLGLAVGPRHDVGRQPREAALVERLARRTVAIEQRPLREELHRLGLDARDDEIGVLALAGAVTQAEAVPRLVRAHRAVPLGEVSLDLVALHREAGRPLAGLRIVVVASRVLEVLELGRRRPRRAPLEAGEALAPAVVAHRHRAGAHAPPLAQPAHDLLPAARAADVAADQLVRLVAHEERRVAGAVRQRRDHAVLGVLEEEAHALLLEEALHEGEIGLVVLHDERPRALEARGVADRPAVVAVGRAERGEARIVGRRGGGARQEIEPAPDRAAGSAVLEHARDHVLDALVDEGAAAAAQARAPQRRHDHRAVERERARLLDELGLGDDAVDRAPAGRRGDAQGRRLVDELLDRHRLVHVAREHDVVLEELVERLARGEADHVERGPAERGAEHVVGLGPAVHGL
jgi:hypothetical protein